MAGNRAYIMLRRNDIPAGLMQLFDLRPNTSQRSLIYEPPGQSGYVNPINVVQNIVITAPAASDPDGTGGNTHMSTTATEYGLRAYLRDRVNVNPGGTDTYMTPAESATIANAIQDLVAAGSPVTLAAVNAELNAALAGADNDLEGTAGTSFGTLEEVLRILAGEVYRVNANTVLATIAGPNAFIALAARVAAIGANTANFFSTGVFSVATDSDYRGNRALYETGALRISVGEGVLSHLIPATYVLLNPAFTYGAGGTATTLASTPVAIPVTGAAAAVVVYDHLGNVIS